MTDKTKPTLEKQIDALVEMRERFLVMAITYKVGDQFDGDFQSIEDAIESLRELAALTARQSQQEPVAWMWLEGTELLNGTEVEQFERIEFSREKPDDDAYGLTPLYTAPASGVQERIALQELRNIVNAKRFDVEVFDDDTAFADWAQSRARHAITRAADQVNADQPADAVVVPSDEELSALSLDSWERKYHKVRKEISLITWEEVYKRAYVEGFLAAQEGK